MAIRLAEKKADSLATTAVSPVRETLQQVEAQIHELERVRVGAYAKLTEQVKQLLDAQVGLRGQTQQLAQALQSPTARGRWGELQLRRVVELAGMREHCDFSEQVSVGGQRPDMVVHLPGGRSVVVDAKAPFDANARTIRAHTQALSKKAYWEQFQPAPDLVVLFLAGEHTFSNALTEDPTLLEACADSRVIIATPTTLIAMLRAIAFGWREESMAEDARKIATLGRELHKRVGDLADAFDNIGRAIGKSVTAYNAAVHHIEQRVLVTARKLEVYDTEREILSPSPVDLVVRDQA